MSAATTRRLILFLVTVGIILPATAVAQAFEVISDVVYGHKDGMALTFDVLKPGEGANGAGVLYMVSGGWYSRYSPPAEVAERLEELLDRGFTVFVTGLNFEREKSPDYSPLLHVSADDRRHCSSTAPPTSSCRTVTA